MTERAAGPLGKWRVVALIGEKPFDVERERLARSGRMPRQQVIDEQRTPIARAPDFDSFGVSVQAFVATLPNDRRFTIEFRNPTWFEEDVYDVLRGRNIAMCIMEQPEFASPVVATAAWGYARLHRLDYDEPALGAWARGLVRCRGARRTCTSNMTKARDRGRRRWGSFSGHLLAGGDRETSRRYGMLLCSRKACAVHGLLRCAIVPNGPR